MAEKTITKKQREEAEALIYKFFDTLDKTKTNSEHYKKMFADMSDAQFLKFISKNFPYRFHQRPFEIEPSVSDACDACEKVLNVPVFETVSLPHQYINKDGKPVETEREQLVIYITLKKMQHFDLLLRQYRPLYNTTKPQNRVFRPHLLRNLKIRNWHYLPDKPDYYSYFLSPN